uniref:Uncharacterized protein n=1 Tax=Haptolina brevifila TaxID=156173 RepID=A0A7S2IQX7_9EUKA
MSSVRAHAFISSLSMHCRDLPNFSHRGNLERIPAQGPVAHLHGSGLTGKLRKTDVHCLPRGLSCQIHANPTSPEHKPPHYEQAHMHMHTHTRFQPIAVAEAARCD